MTTLMSLLRRYFISGLLVWLPIWVTLLVVRFIFGLLDDSVALLPNQYQPEHLLGFDIPGLGVIFALLIIILTGAFAANFFGHQLVVLWDRVVARIPLVRSIYMGVKQILETVFHSQSRAFHRVLLVEYPRKGLWSIAFQTGDTSEKIAKHIDGEQMVTIFIPTTPNPTSGFLMMINEKDAIVLNMKVEQALKFVISLGVVSPELNPEMQTPLQHP